MKRHLVLVVGILLLLFTGLGYYGNFVKWSEAKQATARVLNTKDQWVRYGPGSVHLLFQYQANGSPMRGTFQVTRSTLEETVVNNQLEVMYMPNNPGRVIPLVVLKASQGTMYFTGIAGLVLSVFGVLLSRGKTAKRVPPPIPQ